MTRSSIALILVALPAFCAGQGNLVPNGSFDALISCPTSANQLFNTEHWTNPNAASPDLYHSCNQPLVFPPDTIQWPHMGVPWNAFGWQYAHSGEAYAGIYCFSRHQLDLREYLQVTLTDSIFSGVEYQVSFYVSLADQVRYSINTIGAYFSKEPIFQDNVNRFDVEPQVVNTSVNPLTSKEDWVLITDTFSSRYGGERYITIGNFNTDGTSDTLYHFSGDTSWVYAYYYIDDVSVIALDSIPNSVAQQEQLSFDVWPNPSSEVLHIQSRMPFARLRLLDISGRALLSENIAADRHTLQLAGIPPGLYLLDVTDAQGRRALQKLVVQ